MAIFNRKSFTLVELLVVISIIATLTAILLPNFMGARDRATDSQRKQDLVAMKNALRLYYNENQSYPTRPADGNLGTVLAPFMPAVTNIGFTYEYTQTPGGDGFTLSILTESPNAAENGQSQLICGLGVTDATHYYVCAN